MNKRKLKALAKREHNQILKEHEGLYDRLVSESFPEGEAKKESRKKLWWIIPTSLASATSAVLVFVVAISAFGSLIRDAFSKNDFIDEPAADNMVVSPWQTVCTVEEMTYSLELSQLSPQSFNVSKVVEHGTGQESEYFDVEVDSYFNIEMRVLVDRDAVIDNAFALSDGAEQTVNAHGYDVLYDVSRRRVDGYYSFETVAQVDTGREIYQMRYDYTSKNKNCELLDLIEFSIVPKA